MDKCTTLKHKAIKQKCLFSDLSKLCSSGDMNPDSGPTQLLNKVMFDICCCGTENFQGFTKDTFQLTFDSEISITYVKKVTDELSKNHQETDQEIITGFMPQLLDIDGQPHKLCPV